ncbi:MAG: DUF1592 domain-containing protein [Alphaproteobacteria bacterium]|nr:DUF1592 domain-containing protein [Alphaproteobacteria bacterium]
MRFVLLCSLLWGCGPRPPGEIPVRRLTPTEYNNTVRDLYGFAPDDWLDAEHMPDADAYEEEFVAPWPWVFPADVRLGGFEGMAEGQVVSPVQVEQLERAAAHFSTYAKKSPKFWICDAPYQLEADVRRKCARESAARFARFAWRRPLEKDEEQRLLAAFDGWDAEYGTDAAVTLTAQALLQTPQFLYMPEEPGPVGSPVEDYELASRLSYFLWDSMPDSELFVSAQKHQLRNPAKVRAQAERLLADPRAREMVTHFHRQWLDLDGLQTLRVSFDAHGARYAPDLVGVEEVEAMEEWSGVLNGMRAAMLEEVDLFVEHAVFDGEGTLDALLTSNRGWVGVVNEGWELESSTTAVYGASTPVDGPVKRVELFDGNYGYGIEMRPVEHPADQRAGLLTLGAVLARRAHPVHPAPVKRGVFALQRLMCQELGPPPDGAALAAPPDVLDATSTNRERLEAITSAQGCSGCHDFINPLGFAFESFDTLGGWRDTDAGRPVDDAGELRIPGEAPVAFDGAVDLARHLAASDRVRDCYATQWARYAMGDPEIRLDDPRFSDVRERFRDGGDIRGLLVDLVTSDAFRLRGGM